MEKYLFSIIVPVYNISKYLNECVDSILNQTYQNYELILVDDGSTDGCSDICDEYAANDNRVRVIHKENGGLVSARKAGVEVAQGKYILNVDGDDYLDTEALKILSDICEKTDTDVIAYDYYRFSDKEKVHNSSSVNEGFYNSHDELINLRKKILFNFEKRFFTYGIEPSLCSKAIRKDLYAKYQLLSDSSVSIGEDLMVSLPILLEANSIYVLKKPLYYYRKNESSMTRNYNHTHFEDLLSIIKYFKSNPRFEMDDIIIQLDAYIYNKLYNIFISEAIFLKSLFKTIKQLNKYMDLASVLLSGKHSIHADKKYRLIKFVIDYRMWLIVWFASFIIKRKRR